MNDIPISYRKECQRKLVHLAGLWLPIAYVWMERGDMLLLVAALTVFTVLWDAGRHHLPWLERAFARCFGSLLRTHEQQRLSGASYVMLASLLTVWLFPKPFAITAIAILAVADTAAALVGRRWGRHKLTGGKSWEGTAAFFLSSVVTMLVIGYLAGRAGGMETVILFLLAAIPVSLAATFAELIAPFLKIDDNFTIPLAAGLMFQLVYGVVYGFRVM